MPADLAASGFVRHVLRYYADVKTWRKAWGQLCYVFIRCMDPAPVPELPPLLLTVLGADATQADEWFCLAKGGPAGIPFEKGHVLRIDNEYVKVLDIDKEGVRIRVQRGYLYDRQYDAFFERSRAACRHSSGTLIYALKDWVTEALWKRGEAKGPELRLYDALKRLEREMGTRRLDIRRMPVLFRNPPDVQYPTFCAYTSNVVNCLVAGGRVFMPDPFGPRVDGIDRFQAAISRALLGTAVSPYFFDVWASLHMDTGEVHCGSNVSRSPIDSPGERWWVHWRQ